MGSTTSSDDESLQTDQILCIVMSSISIISGIILLVLVFTKILPHKNKKNISIRIPKLMTLYFYCTGWMLIIAIPANSSLFCFVDQHTATTHHYIGAIFSTISIIPLIIIHISRFALLRIRHGISNATMAFNLGEISWAQYLNKFEIILQEDYSITHPVFLRKYTIYICVLLVAISVIIIMFTNPFFYIWLNCIWLGIFCVFSALIVWIKSDYFNINTITNKFKLDSYSILKEMHYLTIVFLLQFICYIIVSATYPLYIKHEDTQCTGTVVTNIVLCIGLNCMWILQLRYSLRALVSVHKAATLTELLSSYDGYKAFLRFLVSELSIENLEYFQLTMRWRYRICCWQYGIENGTKQPGKDIKLPFKIFSFEYVDRLLPQEKGGGLVPNVEELKHGAAPKNEKEFFTSLPMSRKASFNQRWNYVSPYASNQNSRTTTPRFGADSNVLPPPTAAISHHLPDTIVEGNNEEETDMTATATATYMLQHESFEDEALRFNEDDSLRLNNKDSTNNSTPTHDTTQHQAKGTIIEHLNTTTLKKGTPPMRPFVQTKAALSPVTLTDSNLDLHKIPREDEMIGGMSIAKQNSHTVSTYTAHHNVQNSNRISLSEQSLPNTLKQPILPNNATTVSTRLSPINSEIKNDIETPRTPEPEDKPHMTQLDIVVYEEEKDDDVENEAGMEYIQYHKYKTPIADNKDKEDGSEFDVVDIDKLNPKKALRTVRFASGSNIVKKDNMQYVDVTPDLSPPLAPNSSQKLGVLSTSMNDILSLDRSSSKPLKLDSKQASVSMKSLARDDSIASKAAEPSWFAAWFRKGANVNDGQEERADTMLHFSDLSWRRLKKLSKEVNMSAVARNCVEALWLKYPRSTYLETKGISLEEYDEHMCASWVSCWENMQDSLRRFGKSVHYEKYLQHIGKLTIQKLDESVDELNNELLDIDKNETEVKEDAKKSKFPFVIQALVTRNNAEHTRAAAVVIR